MPVPIVIPMAWRAPRAAPTHHSPSTAQLASLSSAAGRLSRSRMIWRSGRLTQPRFGREQHDAALGVERAGRARRRRPTISAPGMLLPGLRRCTRSASATSRSTTSLAPASAWVGSLASACSALPSSATHPDDEVGPADINAEDESHDDPPLPRPWPPPPPRSRPAARACSDDGPAGRPAGPCAEQGRQASPACPSARLRGAAGAEAHARAPWARRSRPCGVPTAVARCSGAESLVTSSRARSISAADARRLKRARGARRPGPAPRRSIAAASAASSLPPTYDHDRPVERGRELRGSRATAWCPR